jgi:hypothetical protein
MPSNGPGVGPHRAIVGLNNQRFQATAPLIEMVATPERLEFRARFGLRRLMGPCHLARAELANVFLVPGWMGDAIAIHGRDYLDALHVQPEAVAPHFRASQSSWTTSEHVWRDDHR